jgi:2-polyprenyl-3-methyl-5-hydroxy-6-metoxy-1,4-benzoquinol methylase
MNDTVKYNQFDSAPHSTHSLALSLIPAGSRVLEFGCATGYMSEALKTRLDCRVTGVEQNPQAGDMARAHCDRVIIGDAETLDLEALFGDHRFDVMLFADVLEHLRQPDSLLRRVSPFLNDKGAVIASIPNIAHGSVRLALLHGEFRYRDKGLLDNTHIRFFTRESVQDLFEATGYVITRWLRKRMEINRTEIDIPNWEIPEAVKELLAADPEATTYQFIVRAERAIGAAALRPTRAELAAVAANHEWQNRILHSAHQIESILQSGEKFILVDENQFGSDFLAGRQPVPFLERDGNYWGPPPDDATAIQEFERLRRTGAGFIVIGWPAFWWLDHYPEWHRHLRATFRLALENDNLVVFDLRAQR